jgi:hypothetical protein
MSEYSSISESSNYDKSVKNFFEKMYPVSGCNTLHSIISALYRAKPECVETIGDIHTNATGDRTYMTIKIHVSNDFHYTMHLYGIVRNGTFTINESELYGKDDGAMKTYTANFKRTEAWAKRPAQKKSIW